MAFVKILFTLVLTLGIHVYYPYPLILAIGLSLSVGYFLELIIQKIDDNFYIMCAYLLIVSSILTLVCMAIDHIPSRIAVWCISSFGLLGAGATLLMGFAYRVYDEKIGGPWKNEKLIDYVDRKYAVVNWHLIKWCILASPIFIIQILLIFLIKENPTYGFINIGVYLVVEIVLFIMMKIKHIEPETGISDIKSFKDLFAAIGNFFVTPAKEFVAFFVDVGVFFKKLFTGELFKRKPKRVKITKEKTYKAKKGLKLPSFSFKIAPYTYLFAIPVVVCALAMLSSSFGLADGGENFFTGLNDKIKFITEYGLWWKAFCEWFNPIVDEWFFLFQAVAFVLQLPIFIICYVLEGAWWVVSSILIGILKLLILLLGKIVFAIPFVLFGGGIILDIVLFSKCYDKDKSIVIGFILSLVLCLILGILVFF